MLYLPQATHGKAEDIQRKGIMWFDLHELTRDGSRGTAKHHTPQRLRPMMVKSATD